MEPSTWSLLCFQEDVIITVFNKEITCLDTLILKSRCSEKLGNRSLRTILYFLFVSLKPWEFPGWNLKLDPIHGGQGESEESGHPRLVDGKFNKQRNLGTWLIFHSLKTGRSAHLPTWILKVYIEPLTGLSHVYHWDVLNNTLLSQGFVLEMAANVAIVGCRIGGSDKVPLIAPQLVVTSSWWPPTLFLFEIVHKPVHLCLCLYFYLCGFAMYVHKCVVFIFSEKM